MYIDKRETILTIKQFTKMETNFKARQVKDTPFTIIEQEDNVFITIGNAAVIQCQTTEEAEQIIEKPNWNIMFNTMITIAELVTNKKQQNEQ